MFEDEQKLKNDLFEHAIGKLEEHAAVANSEMGAVKEHLGVIETDVAWLKKVVEKMDDKIWYVIGTIILGIVIQIWLK